VLSGGLLFLWQGHMGRLWLPHRFGAAGRAHGGSLPMQATHSGGEADVVVTAKAGRC
jgi:hypothetical protein